MNSLECLGSEPAPNSLLVGLIPCTFPADQGIRRRACSSLSVISVVQFGASDAARDSAYEFPDRGWSASLHTYLTECLVSVARKTRLEIPIPDA